ncbi:ectoine utilization protein EutA [Salinarimonas ramus]|uniref:Ectoine utilization protein EutA n=1 Tax=Salinarimonas ramus TaxID=690164 RepID=A0A917Q3Y2_9HYPH|nr:ectoine utilization protein EutA [Salinarimonas ramus]
MLDLPLGFDAEPVEKRIGLVILATDHTTEPDFARMVGGPDVGLYVARIAYANPTTPANLRAMQPDLARAAALLLPDERLDAICYSCTSASIVIGDEAIAAAIREGKPGVPVVTPTRAAVEALRAHGARRISILTPYTQETSASVAPYFEAHGFTVEALSCLGLDDDRRMARLDAATLREAAAAALAPGSDALFVSCTALRSAAVADEIERALGRPVVTSNLATAWACARLVGERPRSEARLADLPLPDPAAFA